MKMFIEHYGKKWIQKNLQDFNLSCRFVYIYSRWDVTANRYIVPNDNGHYNNDGYCFANLNKISEIISQLR